MHLLISAKTNGLLHPQEKKLHCSINYLGARTLRNKLQYLLSGEGQPGTLSNRGLKQTPLALLQL